MFQKSASYLYANTEVLVHMRSSLENFQTWESWFEMDYSALSLYAVLITTRLFRKLSTKRDIVFGVRPKYLRQYKFVSRTNK